MDSELILQGFLLTGAIFFTIGLVVRVREPRRDVRDELLDFLALAVLAGFTWNAWISGL